MNVRQQQPANLEADNLSPQERQNLRRHVRVNVRQRDQGTAQQANEKRRSEMLDDVPAQFKRTRGAASNGLLCEVFAAERSEAYQAKVSARGKGEFNIAKIMRESPEPAKLVKKLQAALEKEWSTWTKYDAVSIVSPKEAAGIAENLIIGTRGVWTNKGQNFEAGFEPKCRIVGQGFQERYDEKLRRDSPTCSPLMQNLLCSLAATRRMKMMAADARGAFLQGKRIQRELYFRFRKGLGRARYQGLFGAAYCA